MTTFTIIDDDTLVRAIDGCRHRLVYIAPGITRLVADALGRLYERRQLPAITIIIDTDPEVCRLGYGTPEGLKALHSLLAIHQIGLRSQEGLRIGVLVSDEDTLVYAPTPHLIEAGSHTERKPNAIAIGHDPLSQLLGAASAEGDLNAPLPSDAEIGQVVVTPEILNRSLADLERIPPKSFDVSRVERVFNAQLQYVDLEVTGYKLSSRKVTIPNDLLIGEDLDLEKRLRNTFSLLEGKASLQVEIDALDPTKLEPVLDSECQPRKLMYSEQQLEVDRKKLYESFLTNVTTYGWLIKRWDRPAFDQRVAWFRQRIEAYRDGIKAQLEQSVKGSIHELAKVLLPKLKDRFPERLRKHFTSARSTDAEMLALLEQELSDAFGRAHQLINPGIKVVYKDLTYETIMDPKFSKALEQAYGRPGEPSVFSKLIDVHSAARESGVKGKPSA